MLFGLPVECGGDDFSGCSVDLGTHVGDLFRALVNEQNEEMTLRVIAQDAVGDLLEENGLAGAWRGDAVGPITKTCTCAGT